MERPKRDPLSEEEEEALQRMRQLEERRERLVAAVRESEEDAYLPDLPKRAFQKLLEALDRELDELRSAALD